MKNRVLESLGVPKPHLDLTRRLVARAGVAGIGQKELRASIAAVVSDPGSCRSDPHFGCLAAALLAASESAPSTAFEPRFMPAPWRQWGNDIDDAATAQMAIAARLPVAVAGALMPDAHVGYGLPIGGVLATDNAVVPYAVGVDIACRMKLSVFDSSPDWVEKRYDRLATVLERETRFGVGAEFGGRGDARGARPRAHGVLDEDWDVSPVTAANREKARRQLGTSGSGNHFVEFGTFEVDAAGAAALGLAAPGSFLALLSHSGSRGTGAAVCNHYSRLAMDRCRDLPPEMRHLAWLGLDTDVGQEYWAAMQLMGRYAAANHAVIHRRVGESLGLEPILEIENHHNFAWEETHDIGGTARRVIVHRKGATPAGAGVLGVIPGSMAAPGFVVRGRGVAASLDSASHGAGRRMSRTAARETYRWAQVRDFLEERSVRLLSAGIDEVPHAYKDILEVMAAQTDLVDSLARFEPRLVKMAPEGEKPED
jgi:tRNA-splicing ligase RtcB